MRFVKVSLYNTIFGIALLIALSYSNFNSIQIILLLNICGVTFNYLTYSKLYFRIVDKKYIVRFICAYLFLCSTQAGALSFLTSVLGSKVFAMVFILPLILLSNYLVLTKYVYKTGKAEL
jgi:hypothetical protein